MAVREFNGTSEHVKLLVGNLATVTHGTFAALYKVDNTANNRVLMAFLDSGSGFLWAPFVIDDTDALDWWGSGEVTAPIASPQGVWVLAVVRKATGTATPRYSIYNYNTTTWTHGNASGTMTNGTAPTSGFINGNVDGGGAGGEAFDGRLAVTAAWLNTVKWSTDATGDSQIEAAGLHTLLANWVTAAPDSLWPWNPTVVAGIADIVGTAEQTTISGTTLVEGDDPPGFSFSLVAPSTASPVFARKFPPAAPFTAPFGGPMAQPLQLRGERINVNQVVTPAVIETVSTVPAGSTSGGATVTATAVATTTALPVPSFQTSSTVSATAVAVPAALPAPAVQTGSTVTAVSVAAVTAQPAPTIQTGSTVAAVAVATTTAQPAPTVKVDATIAATAIVTTTAMPAPAIQIYATVAATVVASTTVLPAPSVLASVIADPYQATPQIAWMFLAPNQASLQGKGDQTPALTDDSTVTPPTITTTSTADAPSLSTGSVVSATPIATVTALPLPLVSTGTSVTVAVTAVATVTQLPAPTLQTGSTVNAIRIATVTALPAPTTTAGAVVSAVAVATVTQLPAPTLTMGATASPAVVATVIAFPVPVVQGTDTGIRGNVYPGSSRAVPGSASPPTTGGIIGSVA